MSLLVVGNRLSVCPIIDYRLPTGNGWEDGDLVIVGNGRFQSIIQLAVMPVYNHTYLRTQLLPFKNSRAQCLFFGTDAL